MAVLSFDRIRNWYSNTVMLCPSWRRPHQECVSVLRANNPLFGGHLFLGMVVEYPWNLNWKWIWHEIAGMHADHVISMLKTVQDVSCSLLIGAHQSRVTVQSAPSSGYPPLFSSQLIGPGEMIAPLNSMWSFGHITLITQSLAEPHELFGYGPTKNDQIRRSPILTSTVPSPMKDTPDDPTWGSQGVWGKGQGITVSFWWLCRLGATPGILDQFRCPALRLGSRGYGMQVGKSLDCCLMQFLCPFWSLLYSFIMFYILNKYVHAGCCMDAPCVLHYMHYIYNHTQSLIYYINNQTEKLV